MKIRVEVILPGTCEAWAALRVDDVGDIESICGDGYILYSITGKSVGDVKSVVNDLLRCYAAITRVVSEISRVPQ